MREVLGERQDFGFLLWGGYSGVFLLELGRVAPDPFQFLQLVIPSALKIGCDQAVGRTDFLVTLLSELGFVVRPT